MNPETPQNTPEGEWNGREVLCDIDQARNALSLLWRAEVSLPELRQRLLSQDQLHQQDLAAHGYEMAAFLRLYPKEKLQEGRDIHRLRVVSENAAKRASVAEAVEGRNIKIFGIAGKDFEDIEQRSHELLRRMMQEHEDQIRGEDVIPSLRTYTPNFYAVDIAEEKARAAAKTYPRDSILASDVVVLHESDILEKPGNEDEARAMLAEIAGKEVRISSGSVLITTIPSGETILAREGVVMHVTLQQYSHEVISEYLREQREFQSVAGVIDYAHPSAQRLIAPNPIRIERLDVEHNESSGQQICIDPALLTKMRDYCIGMPKEMIQEMTRQVESLK